MSKNIMYPLWNGVAARFQPSVPSVSELRLGSVAKIRTPTENVAEPAT